MFDEDPNDVRVGCDLPNIAGYVVSARGRTADLQVQPVPELRSTTSRWAATTRGQARLPRRRSTSTGSWPSAIPSVLLVKHQSIEVAEAKGFEVAYSYDYQTPG